MKSVLPTSFAVLLILSAAICFRSTSAKHPGVAFTWKNNLIFTALPKDIVDSKYTYHFTGTFEPFRIQQLNYIAETGGSLQSNDVMEHIEFKQLRKAGLTKSAADKFREVNKQLNTRLQSFYHENQNLLPNNEHITREQLERDLNSELDKPLSEKIWHHLVVKCKRLMRDLLSEGAEGSWFDLFSFMPKNRVLANVFELSKMQSVVLDDLIRQALWKEHLENRGREEAGSSGRKLFKQVLVEGAGPVGLYAALQVFVAGTRVVLVNNRPVEYVRNRAFFLDAKWIATLRYYLGTKFDTFFSPDPLTAKGKLRVGEVGQTNCKEIEKILYERLHELAAYFDQESRKAGLVQKPLQMHFDTKMVGVVQESQTNEGATFVGQLQSSDPEKPTNVPFDLMVCAGGGKDEMRDKFLGGPPTLETITKSYGAVIFKKEHADKLVFDTESVFLNAPMEKLRPILQDLKFDAAIDAYKHELPVKMQQKYLEKGVGLTDLIADGLVMDSRTETGWGRFDGKIQQNSAGTPKLGHDPEELVIRLFELGLNLHIASVTPVALEQFFKDLDTLVPDEDKKQQDNWYQKLRQCINRLWGVALLHISLKLTHSERMDQYRVVMEDSANNQLVNLRSQGIFLLHFDPSPVNTAIFPLTIVSAKETVALLDGDTSTTAVDDATTAAPVALVAAVGDANTSAHFMTASGLSSGKIGVEMLAKLLREYNNYKNEHGSSYSIEQFKDNLAKKLGSIKNRVLKKALDYVDSLASSSHHHHQEGRTGGA